MIHFVRRLFRPKPMTFDRLLTGGVPTLQNVRLYLDLQLGADESI